MPGGGRYVKESFPGVESGEMCCTGEFNQTGDGKNAADSRTAGSGLFSSVVPAMTVTRPLEWAMAARVATGLNALSEPNTAAGAAPGCEGAVEPLLGQPVAPVAFLALRCGGGSGAEDSIRRP